MTIAGRIRLCARTAGTILFSLVLWLIGAVATLLTFYRPSLRYRAVCRLMSIWGHGIAWMWGMRIQVSGPRPKAPFFLVSNHIGYTDIVLVCAVCPAWFVSKSEVASWPGIGPLTRMANTIFINRETRKDVKRMNERIANLVREGGGVGFFPEGTTTDGTDVLPFKPSLLQPAVDLGIPVTLAAIDYQTPAGGPSPAELVAWYGDEDFAPHAKRLFAAQGFSVHIRFADEQLQCDNRKDLAVQARKAIQGMLRDMRHDGRDAVAPSSGPTASAPSHPAPPPSP
jgi:1-acyl-sn-glycerol-3-phosphate acyltransferase